MQRTMEAYFGLFLKEEPILVFLVASLGDCKGTARSQIRRWFSELMGASAWKLNERRAGTPAWRGHVVTLA